MNFNNQDRQWFVTLSEAKSLSLWADRCFASLSMTVPVLVVKLHYRGGIPFDAGTKQLVSLPAPWWRFPLQPSKSFAQLLSVYRVARLLPSQSE
jgi:hypothetical protein